MRDKAKVKNKWDLGCESSESLPQSISQSLGEAVMMSLAASASLLPQQRSSGLLGRGEGAAMEAVNGCIASSFEEDSDLGNFFF